MVQSTLDFLGEKKARDMTDYGSLPILSSVGKKLAGIEPY